MNALYFFFIVKFLKTAIIVFISYNNYYYSIEIKFTFSNVSVYSKLYEKIFYIKSIIYFILRMIIFLFSYI